VVVEDSAMIYICEFKMIDHFSSITMMSITSLTFKANIFIFIHSNVKPFEKYIVRKKLIKINIFLYRKIFQKD